MNPNGSIETAEYGLCVPTQTAIAYLTRQRLSVVSKRGVLVFRYPEQEAREVLPVFIQGKGWFYPRVELERDYIRPLPEATKDAS